MAVLYNEVNFNKLINSLGKCCLTENACGSCKKSKCLIGYSKECLIGCLKNQVTYVMDGQANIPLADGKVYDNHDLVDAISDTLMQCKNCKENHFENCIINVLRNCYEILLFGEIQEYKGSTLLYINDIRNENEDIANEVFKRL